MRTIVKILGLLISLPFILVAISFAISNTEPLVLTLWPFETELATPTALAVFITLLVGFAIGSLSSFIGAGRLRKRLRNAEFRLRQMEMENARIKREQEASAEKQSTESKDLALRENPLPVMAAE